MRVRRPRITIVSVALLGWLGAGCLEEDPPLNCPKLTPTGGEFAGRWEALDFCITETPSSAECPQERTFIEGAAARGSIAFQADGTYVQDMVISYGVRSQFPLSCYVQKAASCHDLAAVFAAELKAEAPAISATVFCRGTDQCRCAARVDENDKFSGRLLRVGNTLTDGTGSNPPLEFSVTGNELRLQRQTSPGGPAQLFRFSRL